MKMLERESVEREGGSIEEGGGGGWTLEGEKKLEFLLELSEITTWEV